MLSIKNIFFSAPDDTLIEVATGGERMAAYMRLIVIGFLWLCPVLVALFIADRPFELYVGMGAASIALAIAFLIFYFSDYDNHKTARRFVISIFDISLVSFTLIFFALNGRPESAINSMVIWELYLLFIIASCLYFDIRVCITAGAMAMFQYFLILMWVTHTWDMNALNVESNIYTGVSWYIQLCRFVLLLIATLVAIGIVFRSRNLLIIAGTDPLTGLDNRRVLEARLTQELSRALRESSVLSVAYVDIDHFKKFNDQWGHSAGDLALKFFAHSLKHHIRTEDIISRWGGEEFVIVFPNTTKQKAQQLLERIQLELKNHPLVLDKGSQTLKFSAGISQFSEDGTHQAELVHNADICLRLAKETGRDKVLITN